MYFSLRLVFTRRCVSRALFASFSVFSGFPGGSGLAWSGLLRGRRRLTARINKGLQCAHRSLQRGNFGADAIPIQRLPTHPAGLGRFSGFDALEEIGKGNPKSVHDPLNAGEPEILATRFHVTHVRAVDSNEVRERFLAHAALFPEFPDPLSDAAQ